MEHFKETRELLDSSSLFYIITTGMDGNYSYVNSNYARQFSHVHGELVGQPYYITMHPDDRKTCEEVAAKCFDHPGSLFPATIRKHDGKGDYLYTRWDYRAMLGSDGSPAGVFCLGYNITEYVAEGIQLELANKELDRFSSRMRDIMFQQSHLVRAPLSNILGLADIVDLASLDSNTRNIFEMVTESAKKLDGVVRSIANAAHGK
jgi:PAS domain S-box-containing protein